MRGRKKQEDSKRKVVSFRVTDEEHEVLAKNSWLKKDLAKIISDYLANFIVPKP